jgi:hypothetical protein
VPLAAPELALSLALLWLVHPLQTERVTYLIQRAEALMGLFYLLILYCLVRGATVGAPIVWYCLAIGFCVLGMGSKQVMVTASLLALLCDRALLAPSWGAVLRKRWAVHAGLLLTWCLLASLGCGGRASPDLGASVCSARRSPQTALCPTAAGCTG